MTDKPKSIFGAPMRVPDEVRQLAEGNIRVPKLMFAYHLAAKIKELHKKDTTGMQAIPVEEMYSWQRKDFKAKE